MDLPIATDDSSEALPHPTGLPPLTEEQAAAKHKLLEVQGDIRRLSTELLTCSEKEIPRVARELQRARVAMLTLGEIVTGMADPTTYRELTLLTKMLSDREIDEPTAEHPTDAQADTEARLRDSGVDPEAAAGMVRVLNALRSIMDGPHAPDSGE